METFNDERKYQVLLRKSLAWNKVLTAFRWKKKPIFWGSTAPLTQPAPYLVCNHFLTHFRH